MKARIAEKIYYHRWLADRCIGRQQYLNYMGADPCCEYYGDKDCQKCCLYDKEGERLNYKEQQLDKAERIFNRRYKRKKT